MALYSPSDCESCVSSVSSPTMWNVTKEGYKKTHVEEHQHTAQHLQLRHRNVVMTGEHLILLQKTLFQREREREREKTAKNKRIFQIQ